ncbi:MAG: acyltransferase family protein, partial [Eubacteriales bacterium]
MKERNPNVEFLRVIMMLLIIMLHLSGELFDIKNIIHQSHSLLVSSIFVIRSFCFLGVSTFAFISGYYGILTSTGKKLIRFEFFALTWGLIFIILDFLFNGFSSVNNLILFLMPTTSGICWYFSSYMLLLIFAPYISFGFEHFDLKINRSIVVVVVLLCYGGSFLFHQNGTSFMLLLYIYIIGRYLRLYPIAKWENNSGSIAYFSIAINALLAFMISYFNIGKGFC